MTPDEISILRLIKRSAVILIALLKHDQPVTARQLSNMITLDYATTRHHINELTTHGLAVRVTGGYHATDHAAEMLGIKARINRAPYSIDQDKSANKPRFHKRKARKNRANAGNPTPLLSTIIIKNHNDISNNNNSTPEARKNRANANKPRSELWQTLSLYGILPNARTMKLESMPHITPALVKQLADQINKPFPKYAGLLIRALETSADNPPPHPKDCTCSDCRRKYVTGKYSDYVNA